MSLKKQLEEMIIERESIIDSKKLEIMHKETANLELSGFLNNALKVGDTMPNFNLPNTFGKNIDLYELLENGPVVISFYRGSWCPYCNLTLQTLNNTLKEIKDKHSTLVAISPQTPDNSLSTAQKLHLDFEVLSDTNNEVAKNLGLVFELSPELKDVYQNGFGLDFSQIYGSSVYELPVPATFVVDKSKIVKYAFLDVDYRKRAEPKEILEVLNNL